MTRDSKKVRREVKIITDPHPTFVSLVNHGANQTPFKSVKVADLEELKDTMKKETEKVTKAGQPDGADIHKFVFQGDNFKTEADVTKYMTSKGYSNFAVDTVEGDAGGFIVKGIAEESFEEVHPLPVQDGVTVFVGKLTAEAEKATKDDISITISQVKNPGEKRQTNVVDPNAAPLGNQAGEGNITPAASATNPGPGLTSPAEGVDKADSTKDDKKGMIPFPARKEEAVVETPVEKVEKTAKVDSYMAYFTDETTIADVLKEAEDGIPVGFCDVNAAFMGALKNLVKAGDTKQISTLCAEFGTLIVKLVSLTDSLGTKSDKDEAIERLFKSTEVPSSDVTKMQSDSSGDKAVKTVEALKTDEPAIAKAIEPLMEMLKALQASVKDSTTKTAEEVQKVANRVVKLEKIRQMRQGASADDVTPSGGKETKADDAEPVKLSKLTANLFGMQLNSKADEDARIVHKVF